MNQDTIYSIMEYLFPKEIMSLGLTNKMTAEVFKLMQERNVFWKHVYLRKFRLSPLSGTGNNMEWISHIYRRKLTLDDLGFFDYDWKKLYEKEKAYRDGILSYIKKNLPNTYFTSMTLDIIFTLNKKMSDFLLKELTKLQFPIVTPNNIYDILSSNGMMSYFQMVNLYKLLPSDYIEYILSQDSQMYVGAMKPVMVSNSVDKEFLNIILNNDSNVNVLQEISLDISPIVMQHESLLLSSMKQDNQNE